MTRWTALFLCLPSLAFAQDYEVSEITSGLLPGTGTALNLGDDQSVSVDLPFTFNYFGNDYDSAWVSSNGFLSFSTNSNLCCNASEIDSSGTPRNTLFGMWGDPDPRRGETLTGNPYTMTTTGTGGASAFVTGWYGVPEYSTQNYFTVQIVLLDDNSFEFRYGDVTTYQSTDSQYARNHTWLAGFTGPSSTDNELLLYGHDMSSLSNSSFRAAMPSSIDCMIFPSSPGCESVPDPVFEDDFYEDDTFDFYSDGSDDGSDSGQFDGSDDGQFDTFTGEDTFSDETDFVMIAGDFSDEEDMGAMTFVEDFDDGDPFTEDFTDDFTMEVFFEEQVEMIEEADLREEIREEVFEEMFEELIEEEIFIEETVIFIEELEAEVVELVVEEAAAELLEEKEEVALEERLELELLSPDEVAALVPSVGVSSGGNWSQTFGSSGVSGGDGGGMVGSFVYGTDEYAAFGGGSGQPYTSDSSSNTQTTTSATAAATNPAGAAGAAAAQNDTANVSSPVGQATQQEVVADLVVEAPPRQNVTTEFFQAAADQNNEVLGTEAQDIAVAELTAAPAGFDAYSLTTIPDRLDFYLPTEFYEDSIPQDNFLNLYRLLQANDATYSAMMDDQYD